MKLPSKSYPISSVRERWEAAFAYLAEDYSGFAQAFKPLLQQRHFFIGCRAKDMSQQVICARFLIHPERRPCDWDLCKSKHCEVVR